MSDFRTRQIFMPVLSWQELDQRPWDAWSKGRRTASRRLKAETGRQAADVEVDFTKFTPEKYLLSWATAVSGVEPEDDGHTIVLPHSNLVNDNGNAWLNQVLLESYHSFILAENYLEHVQVPELSKGKILDAVAWVCRDHDQPTVFVDILVATDRRRHPKLVASIRKGDLNTMSMGCDITWSQCSRCGKQFEEGKDRPCVHIREQIGKWYTDDDGKKRRIAELCGLPGKPGSCEFKECSWVRKPAFRPARLHGFIRLGQASTGRPLRARVPKRRIEEASQA